MESAQQGDESIYQLHRGFLYRLKSNRQGQEVKQLALPKELRHKVMKPAHAWIMSGHQGVHPTQEQIFASFWWPGMSDDVTRFCRDFEDHAETYVLRSSPRLGLVPGCSTVCLSRSSPGKFGLRSLRDVIRKEGEGTTLDPETAVDKGTGRSRSPYHLSVCCGPKKSTGKDLEDGP